MPDREPVTGSVHQDQTHQWCDLPGANPNRDEFRDLNNPVCFMSLIDKWSCRSCGLAAFRNKVSLPLLQSAEAVILRWSPSVDVHQLLLMWLECSSLNILLMNQKNFNISHEFLWMSFTNSDILLYFQFLILFICRTPNQRHLWWKRQVTVDSFFSSSSFLMLPSGKDGLPPSSLSSILFCHTGQGLCDRRGLFGCDQKLMVVSTYWLWVNTCWYCVSPRGADIQYAIRWWRWSPGLSMRLCVKV